MMLMAASWPSKSEAAVTRTDLVLGLVFGVPGGTQIGHGPFGVSRPRAREGKAT